MARPAMQRRGLQHASGRGGRCEALRWSTREAANERRGGAQARLFAAAGVTKIRLTGGEPTIRRDIVQLAEGLAGVPGVAAVGITTNGIALQRKLPALKAAGARPRTVRSLRLALLHVSVCVDRVDGCRENSGTEDGHLASLAALLHWTAGGVMQRRHHAAVGRLEVQAILLA